MRAWVRRAVAVARAVGRAVRTHNVTFMAGSIAYSAFLSLLPLLLLLLVVASAVGSDLLSRQILDLSRTYLSPSGQGLLVEALTNASERAGASAIGVVSLVWGMFRIFRGLKTAFTELYGTAAEENVYETVRDAVIVFLALGLATVGAGVATAAFALVPEIPFRGVLNPLVLVVGLTVAFVPIYYIFPGTDVSAREAVPGAVVAAVGWALLEALFQVYVGLVDTVAMYGTIGGVILLLFWLYGSAFVLLVGATLNVVLAGRTGETPSPVEDESVANA